MVKRRGGLREGFELVLGFSAAGLSGCSDMGGKSPYPEAEQYLKNRYGGRFEIEEAAGNKIFFASGYGCGKSGDGKKAVPLFLAFKAGEESRVFRIK